MGDKLARKRRADRTRSRKSGNRETQRGTKPTTQCTRNDARTARVFSASDTSKRIPVKAANFPKLQCIDEHPGVSINNSSRRRGPSRLENRYLRPHRHTATGRSIRGVRERRGTLRVIIHRMAPPWRDTGIPAEGNRKRPTTTARPYCPHRFARTVPTRAPGLCDKYILPNEATNPRCSTAPPMQHERCHERDR